MNQIIQLSKPVLTIVLLFILLTSCRNEDRTTQIYGKVTNLTGQPVSGVPIIIAGQEKHGFVPAEYDLDTAYSDVKGNYISTLTIDKKYRRLKIINMYFKIDSLEAKYRDYDVKMNGVRTDYCCPAEIGKRTEYNFILLPR